MVQFRGSVITSDARLLAYQELEDAAGLSAMAGEPLTDARTGKNGHLLTRSKGPRSMRYGNRMPTSPIGPAAAEVATDRINRVAQSFVVTSIENDARGASR